MMKKYISDDGTGWLILAITILSFLIMGLLQGCCPCRNMVIEKNDSVRIEYRERVVEKNDTLYVHIPRESVRNATTDTTSTVETSLAVSTVTIDGGIIYHDLVNKDTSLQVNVVTKTIYVDSINYRDRVVSNTTDCRLTRLQNIRMDGFWVLLFIVFMMTFFIIFFAKK